MTRRSAILGYVVMIVLLSAGAAQSLSGSNTVASDDIINGQVYGADIHDRAVTGAKVLDNSITGADVNEATLDLPDIHARTSIHYADVPAHGFVVAYCPEGYVATGGGDPFGPGIGSENYGVTREGLFPMNGETVAGWTVQNPSDSPQRIYVQVVCLKF